MKHLIVIALTIISFGASASPLTDSIGNDWRHRNNETADIPVTVDHINLQGRDIYYAYSSFYCGSQGCTYDIYTNINDKICMVGTYYGVIDNLQGIGNPSCGTGEITNIATVESTSQKDPSELFTVMVWPAHMKFQSKADHVTLDNLVVNRGNCVLIGRKGARKLKFAGTTEYAYLCDSPVIEFSIDVNGTTVTMVNNP